MSETRLHEHLRRFGWVYGLSLLLMLLPIGLWRGYVVKPLPEAEVERARQAVERAFERAHPELRTTTTLPRMDPLLPNLDAYAQRRQQKLFEMLTAAPQSAAMQAELDWLAQTYEPVLEQLDDFARRGLNVAPFLLSADPNSTTSTESYLAYQTCAKVQRMLAERAVWRGAWDEALTRLEALGRISNLVRDRQLLGHLIAIAARSIAYGGYATLLQADPPVEVLNNALQALQRLEASEPAMDCWTLLGDQFLALNYVQRANRNQQRWSGFSPARYQKVLLLQTAMEYALQAENIKTPRLRQWGETQARRFGLASLNPNGLLMLASASALEWTATPAATRWLREVAAHEPELCRKLQLDVPELADMDPLWRMELLTPRRGTMPNLAEIRWRARVMQTQGRLVAAGLAMRLYRAEHGDWPEMAEAPGFAWLDATTTETGPVAAVPPARPFWPLHMGWVTLDDAETSYALWNQRLPIRELMQRPPMKQNRIGIPGEASTMGGRSLESTWPGDEELNSPQAFREVFPKHPALVTSATLGMHPILTNVCDPTPRKLGLFIQDEDSTQRLPMADANAFWGLKVGLKAPARVRAVWSAGPDGVDDGGRMQYDPTNGTYSRGDQVIFPERF